MLPSGAVPPHFLSTSFNAMSSGFNKKHKNYPLRSGVIIKAHAPNSSTNLSKTTMEYDVLVAEQNENKSLNFITYRNCPYQDGLGGLGDFFEKTLRYVYILMTVSSEAAVIFYPSKKGLRKSRTLIISLTHQI